MQLEKHIEEIAALVRQGAYNIEAGLTEMADRVRKMFARVDGDADSPAPVAEASAPTPAAETPAPAEAPAADPADASPKTT